MATIKTTSLAEKIAAADIDPDWAEMVAAQQGPDLKGTDSQFFANIPGRNLADQYKHDPDGLRRLIAACKKKGFTPSMNSVYMPTLADEKGDPDAFISSAGDLKRACIKKGRVCEGSSVTVTEAEVAAKRQEMQDKPRPEKPAIAEDIVQKRLAKKVAANPELGVNPQKLADAREEIIKKHSRKR